MSIAKRIYRRLGEAFPHEFKLAYGDEMMRDGEDVMEEIARRHGAAGLLRMMADLAIRLPIEYLSEMRRDMRYAVRALVKSPGFALVGIVSMGLGIGLTTNEYSSGWAVITRTLPGVADAGRLVAAENPVSYPYIERYRAQKDLFSGAAAVETGLQFNVGLQNGVSVRPERVFGQLVSPDYFSVLGMEAQRGRLLEAGIDKAGAAPVVVISDRFWRSRLNADPDAVGQTIRVNGQTATIVGITPRNFDGALSMNPSELFVPTTVPASLAPELGNDVLHQRNAKEFVVLMRLAPGVSVDAAEAALDGITRRMEKEDGAGLAQANRPQEDKAKRVVLVMAGTRAAIPRRVRPVILGFYAVLMTIVSVIACLNLATMLLARGANRRRELAIRLGVGASRFRLIRQMMSEGILLSLLGGAAGFALAYGLGWANAQVPHPAGAPLPPNLAVDWHAAIFAFALAVVCGIGFSVAPALQATKTDVAPALKDGSALQLSGYRRFGMRNLAMGLQVAGSLTLLLVTGFLVLGVMKGSSVPTNFDKKTMVFLSIDPVRDGYSPEKAQQLFEQLPERLRAAGDLRSFALSAQPPFALSDDGDFQLTVEDGRESAPAQKAVVKNTVGAGYFAALNEPMVAGREFGTMEERSRTDSAAAVPVVLNQSAARDLFGKGNALGKRIRNDRQSYEVVGVAPDLRDGTGMKQPIAYVPLRQSDFARPPAGGVTIMARADTAADALDAVRSAIASIDRNVTPFNVQTLSEYLELSRYAARSALRNYGSIGLFGLVLSAVGLAGVTAYAVTQRRKEIGIRVALGARKGQVLWLVLREATVLITAGMTLGFLCAVALARALSAVASEFADAFQVGTNDPLLLVGAPLLLAGLAMLACYIPALRAVRIDPLRALRQD